MLKKVRLFVMGCICTAFVMNSTVILAETTKTITAVFGKVQLIVNGTAISQETLLYNGTTYVPLRAVAEAFGKEVDWDGATSTVSINDEGYTTPAATPTDAPTSSDTPLVTPTPTPTLNPTPEPMPNPTPNPTPDSGSARWYPGVFSDVPKPNLSSSWEVESLIDYTSSLIIGERSKRYEGFNMQIKYIDKSGRYNATGVAEQYFNKLKENGFEPTYTGELWGVDYLGDIYIYVKGDIYVEVDVFNNINDFNGIIVHLSSGDFAARAYNWMP